ncbi:MAG: glycerol-3-phosphate 1-O-acyltransferase PlsY [bacterium]|nr:MAG: glycerol-3-phosphate 1-O-acyltransferase PlsY [bacterium]
MDTLFKILLVSIPSYLIGAVPSSFIMGKLVRGIDLRDHGSGNLGAANTFRVLGTKAALPVLIFDIGKGFIAVQFFSKFGGTSFAYALLAAFVVVLGHNYSLFVGFSGGKGIGTTSGVFLALAPHAVGICFGLWIVALLMTRIVSVASLVAAIALPLAILFSNRAFDAEIHGSILVLSIAVVILVIYKHRSNIRRLREGTEKKIF